MSEPPVTADHTPERLSEEDRDTDPSGGAVEVWIDLDLDYPDPPDVVTLGENGPYYRPGDMGHDLGVALMRAEAERDHLAAHLADVEARLAAVEALAGPLPNDETELAAGKDVTT